MGEGPIGVSGATDSIGRVPMGQLRGLGGRTTKQSAAMVRDIRRGGGATAAVMSGRRFPGRSTVTNMRWLLRWMKVTVGMGANLSGPLSNAALAVRAIAAVTDSARGVAADSISGDVLQCLGW